MKIVRRSVELGAIRPLPFGNGAERSQFGFRPKADVHESHLGLLCEFQCIIQFDAQVTNGAFNLGVSEKQLDRA